MEKNRHFVAGVEAGSIAEEMEIQQGDELLRINDQPIEDIFDYRYMINGEYIEALIRKPDGEEWLLEIEKDFDEDLGIRFENEFMDDYRSCRNKCIFCFIDQMPKGMRDTLYFKDDDSRLSFLQGNYVTLTNMSESDIDRIIRYRMEPINISFHTTNPELRCQMLHNRRAGDFFDAVRRLHEAGITMNGQIVLCKGFNDGEELDRTIGDLIAFVPTLQSLSVVPVGLTRFRDGLQPLEPFNKEDAQKVLQQIHHWQNICKEKTGVHFVQASDEWYLLAEQELPEPERYDGYLQLENGVGMLRLLDTEVDAWLAEQTGDERVRRVSIATGELPAPFIERLTEKIREKFPQMDVAVYPICNHFFGEKITVSGLITGTDLKEQLKNCDLGEELLIPCNMLRSGENVFLDDVTVEELEETLHVPVCVVDPEGEALCRSVTGEREHMVHRRRQMYEQTDRSNRR